MPDTTLTINHAGGGSETYTINRDKFEGVREMTVGGLTILLDRSPDVASRAMFIDGVPIYVNNYFSDLLGYFQPDGASRYFQPDGSSLYQTP